MSYQKFALARAYFKIALRSFLRQKGYSFINLAGLSIGMACCLLILIYVQDELNYDTFHADADQIYRVATNGNIRGVNRTFALSPGPMGPALPEVIPEVLEFVRCGNPSVFTQSTTKIKYKDKEFEESRIWNADSTFFSIFSFDFLAGDAQSSLTDPQTVVLTESTAEKIFGNEDPMGKTINDSFFGDLEITGVVRDVPKNSHFTFDYVVSIASIPAQFRIALASWLAISNYTYIKITDGADPKTVEQKIADLFEEKAGATARRNGIEFSFFLQKMTDIHLRSNLEFEAGSNSSITSIAVFAAIAFFVLLIACINFMNLATAKSARRAREVGMRKVFGAQRKNIIYQFLGESIILAGIGLVLSVLAVLAVLPTFNDLSGKNLGLEIFGNGLFVASLLGLSMFTGAFAGSYPAFFLSSFNPTAIFRGKSAGSSGSLFRKILVLFQFSVSTVLIIATLIILGQIEYMQGKNLGFDKERILVVLAKDISTPSKYLTVKNELINHPSIHEVSFSSSVPGRVHGAALYKPEGNEDDETHLLDTIFTDHDFIKTYGIEIVQGRDFSIDFATDSAEAFIINEAAAEKLGYGKDAVGKGIELVSGQVNKKGKIVGILKDFHNKSLKTIIEPTAVVIWPSFTGNINLRIDTNNISGTLSFLREKWQVIEPGRELDYFFLDDDFNRNYQTEETQSRIFSFFALLAIGIACLGLFGLASFTAEQQTKEIGIRKVLGASVKSIVVRLSTEFTKWVLLANVVAWPLSYYVMSQYWLSNFPYRISPGITTFLLATGISIAIAIITVSYQSIRAGLKNPVTSLRYE